MSQSFTLPGEATIRPVPGTVIGIQMVRTAQGLPTENPPIVLVTHVGDAPRPHEFPIYGTVTPSPWAPTPGAAYLYQPGRELRLGVGVAALVSVPVEDLRALVELPGGHFRAERASDAPPMRHPAAVPIAPVLPPEPVRDVRRGIVADGMSAPGGGLNEARAREFLGGEPPAVVTKKPMAPHPYGVDLIPSNTPHARQIGADANAERERLEAELEDIELQIAADQERENRAMASVVEARRRASIAIARGEPVPTMFADRDVRQAPAFADSALGPIPLDLSGPEAQDLPEDFVRSRAPAVRPSPPPPEQPSGLESAAQRRAEALRRALGRTPRS
ncbi:MAG: hypothetical protein IT508_10875 [Burkholderiaceae bacterium]|nr:hypothetical protein [Burkholderiaceae bacterium]